MPPDGFEPPTPGSGNRCSTPLSYGGQECVSQDSNLVCHKATGLQPAGRSDVHDTRGVTDGVRTRDLPSHSRAL